MKKPLEFFKKHILIIGLILLIPVIIFVGQKLLSSDSISTSSTNSQTTTSEVKKGTIVSSVSASGQIQTANYLAVTTSVNGIVKKVYVKEGDKVIAGQKIMEITLDSEGEKSLNDAYSSYLRAKNSLTAANAGLYTLETNYLQKKEAFETEKKKNSYQTHAQRLSYTYAENDYLKAKSDYDSQKASITQLQIALNSAWNEYQSQSPIITATTDGIIANIVAVEGIGIENSVSERSVKTVASIKKEGTPIASLNVSELDINNVKVGQKVNLTLNSVSNKTFVGTVVGIDKVGTESSGVSNYPVIVKFDSDSDLVLPNMGVEADVITNSKENVLYVPTAAITTSKGVSTVKVLNNNDGAQETVTIKTGISDSTNTEITEGLSEGENVVIEALPTTGFTSTSNSNSQNRGGGGMGILSTFTRR